MDTQQERPAPGVLDEERLSALHATELLDTPAEEGFDRLTKLVCRLLKVPVSLVSLVDVDRQFFKSSQGLPEPWATLCQTPLSHSFCQHVVSTQEPLVISDARSHPLVRDNLAVRDLNVIAYLGIPLRTPEGYVLGSLCAIDSAPRSWSKDEIAVLAELAELVMTEIDLRHQLRERKRTEEALAVKAEALRRSNEELEQFAYIASHDLKEPLRTINSFVQLLQQRYHQQLDADASQFMGFIVDASKRMQALIEGLLTYSRVENPERPRQSVDLNAVLAQVADALQTTIEETDARLTYDPLPTVLADETQMYSLLQNLVSNGIKFRGAETPRLHISATRENGFWRFSVQDNGIGIEEPYHEQIFRLFKRLHGRSAYEGSGLGLSLCKKIVTLHGGRIWLASEPGQGTTFFFTLPAQDVFEEST